MPKRSKCLYCQMSEMLAAELIAPTKTQQEYFVKRQLDYHELILKAPQTRNLHACNKEHLDYMLHMRKVAKFTQRQLIRQRSLKVSTALRQLRIEQNLYNKVIILSGSEGSGPARIQKLKVNHQKTLLAQRLRRLKEVLPQVPEDQRLLDAFLTREYLEHSETPHKRIRHLTEESEAL